MEGFIGIGIIAEPKFRIALLCGVALFFAAIFVLLKKNKLSVRYSILWFLSGCALIVFALFPYIVLVLGDLIRVVDPSNFVFMAAIAFIIFVLLSLSVGISALEEKNKRLAQSLALAEERLRRLEAAARNDNSPQE